MGVGGWIIEILPSAYGPEETQITVVNREGDESCVYVETAAAMPLAKPRVLNS